MKNQRRQRNIAKVCKKQSDLSQLFFFFSVKLEKSVMPSIYKPDFFFRELYFVFVEKHVRDAVRNGKSSACLRTHEVAVDNVDFH